MNEESKKLFLETNIDLSLLGLNLLDFKTKLIDMGWYFISKQINNDPVRIHIYESQEDYMNDEIMTIGNGSTFDFALLNGLKKCQEYYQR